MIEGFLGTRADFILDAVTVGFAFLPPSMIAIIMLAKKQRFKAHRNMQILLFLAAFVMTLALEVDLRFGDVLKITRQRPMYGSALVWWAFVIHVSIAIGAFISWLTLLVRSSRRFGEELPGDFSSQHRLHGRITFVGVTLTSLTGIALYVVVFVL